jgi:membrane protein
MTLKRIWALIKQSVASWIDDYAPSMGAALAYYTLFSIAPLLLIVIAVAGFFFGAEAARGEIFQQLNALIGEEGAVAVEGLLESASKPEHGAIATVVGIVALLIGATTVFAELQSDLDRIWRAPAAAQTSGIWGLIRGRLLSLGMVAAIGFLLLASLVVSAILAALGKWWGAFFPGWEVLLQGINFVLSFAIIMGLFALIYKILPSVKIAWHDVWIGAAVTALLFTIGKSLIGLYLGKSAVTSGFGAAGSFVVLLVWVYYSAQIFLLGAEFTWVYSHSHGSRASEPQPEAPPAIPMQSQAAAASNPEEARPRELAPAKRLVSSYERRPEPEGFVQENPLKVIAALAALGLILGRLLRELAPPERIVQPRRAPPSDLQDKLKRMRSLVDKWSGKRRFLRWR